MYIYEWFYCSAGPIFRKEVLNMSQEKVLIYSWQVTELNRADINLLRMFQKNSYLWVTFRLTLINWTLVWSRLFLIRVKFLLGKSHFPSDNTFLMLILCNIYYCHCKVPRARGLNKQTSICYKDLICISLARSPVYSLLETCFFSIVYLQLVVSINVLALKRNTDIQWHVINIHN